MIKAIHILRSLSWGGLESYTLDYLLHHKDWMNSTLLCYPQSPLAQYAMENNISITFNIFDLFRFHWDLIHVHQKQDLVLGRLGITFNPKSLFFYTLMMGAPKKKRLHHYWIYQRCQAIFTSSLKTAEDIKKNFPVQPHQVCYLPYGRDMNIFTQNHSKEAQAIRLSQNASSSIKVFGTVSRIDRAKGIKELAQTVEFLSPSTLSQIQIWIIGDPTLKKSSFTKAPEFEKQALEVYKEIQDLQKKYPDQIKIFPYQKKIASFYHAFDVFVLASYEELYSLAVIEAMVCGKPILGTNAGGTIEQVGLDRGILVTPRSAEALAQGMEKLIQSDLVSMGYHAQSWALKTHNWDHHRSILFKKIKEFSYVSNILD